MNFISKTRISQILNGSTTGSYRVTSPWGALQLFGNKDNNAYKILDKTELRYTNQFYGTIDTLDIKYNNAAASAARTSLSGIYPKLPFDFNDNWFYISLSAIGDGIVPGSFYYQYDTNTIYKDYSFSADAILSYSSNKIGYIADESSVNTPMAYIFYDEGVIWGGSTLGSHVNNWVSEADSYLEFKTKLDEFNKTYFCNLDTTKTWSSGNFTYWQSIDKTDDAITSSLTSYWLEWGLLGYTISANADDYLILGDLETPLYITGIGLYDDENDLVAVAKLRRPQRVARIADYNFKVELRF